MAENVITHRQLRIQVAERLRSAILDGELRPGEWLRQERLAQEYGVSQMPVREALKELAAEGLVQHVPYRGVRVVEFSAADIADLYAHRAFLESMAARAAAERVTPEEIAELKRLRNQMAAHMAPEDLHEYRQINRRFHEIVFAASRRTYLVRTLAQMWAAMPTMLLANFAPTATQPLPARDAGDLQEHDAIIFALEQRDPDAAERAVRHHIESAGAQLVARLREQQPAPSSGD